MVVRRYNFKKSKQKIKIILFQNVKTIFLSKYQKSLKGFGLFDILNDIVLDKWNRFDRKSGIVRRQHYAWQIETGFSRIRELSVVDITRYKLKPVFPEFRNRALLTWRATNWNRFDWKSGINRRRHYALQIETGFSGIWESSVVNMRRDKLKPVWLEVGNRPAPTWRINFWSCVTAGLVTMA